MLSDVQVKQEAEQAFGQAEAEPSRQAAEQMTLTLSCLQVPFPLLRLILVHLASCPCCCSDLVGGDFVWMSLQAAKTITDAEGAPECLSSYSPRAGMLAC